MDLGDALSWLDGHLNVEALPERGAALRLETMRRLMDVMAEPQRHYPVIHLTGTNGKTSTARILTSLLVAKGLSVGAYTSPHLELVNERMAWNAEPIADGALAVLLAELAGLEPMLAQPPSWFELLTAAAFRWFADIAVEAAVVEVGLGGRYDATNVADGQVAVVTNVGIDHVEYIGPSRRDIAVEKAGIVKPGSVLVLGEDDPELADVFASTDAAETWVRGEHWGCVGNRPAHGGRLLDIRTPGAGYEDLYLPLHGAHQGDNAAAALAAAEAFFGRPVEEDLVSEAFAVTRSPGRMEVVGRQPLCILDGAHNPAGARAAAATLAEEFAAARSCVLVLGVLHGRDPLEMLKALGEVPIRLVVACPPPSPRAVPAEEVAAAAGQLGLESTEAGSVADAVELARDEAGPDELVFVTGSLYVVGAARAILSGVHSASK